MPLSTSIFDASFVTGDPFRGSMRVHTVEHRCQPEPRTHNLLEALRREIADQYRSRHMDPALVALPRTLARALGDEIHRLSTQTIQLRVPVDSLQYNMIQPPVPAPPPPAPPVTGISPEHLELLRKVVAAGVEWDMMSAEEGGALLESVAAVKPTVRQVAGTSTSTTGRLTPLDIQNYLTTGVNLTSATPSTAPNRTATEVLQRMEEAQRLMGDTPPATVNLSHIQGLSFSDIEWLHDDEFQSNNRALREHPPITPDPLRSEGEEPRPRPPHPLPRSRFYRPGGR